MLTICYNGEVGIGMDPAFSGAVLNVNGATRVNELWFRHGGPKIGEWEQVDKMSFHAQNGFSFSGGRVRAANQFEIQSSHLIYSGIDGVINFGGTPCTTCPTPPTGSLWFRSTPQAGNINTFNQLMILTYDGRLGINSWGPPTSYKLYVGGNVLIDGDAWSNRGLLTSDERLKTDIRPLTNDEKENIYLLQGKFYTKIAQIEDNTNLVEDIIDVVVDDSTTLQVRTISERKKQIIETTEYGYLAQELKEIFPDLVSQNDEGYYGVNYIGLIPIIVEVLKDQKLAIEIQQKGNIQQQKEIKVLQDIVFAQEKELNEMRNIVVNCCKNTDIMIQDPINNNHKSNSNNNTQSQQTKEEAVLYQNTPNPFSSNTEISCDIPKINNNAFIYVHNLQGIELMSFPIVQIGYNTVYVHASALPAGMYLYTLVVDNVIISTKRMILTK